MPARSNRVFDDLSRLMNDAAGMAKGARREAETVVRGQVERFLASMDVVSRDEFEAVRQMAIRARDENDRLERRIAALEARLAATGSAPASTMPGNDPAI